MSVIQVSPFGAHHKPTKVPYVRTRIKYENLKLYSPKEQQTVKRFPHLARVIVSYMSMLTSEYGISVWSYSGQTFHPLARIIGSFGYRGLPQNLSSEAPEDLSFNPQDISLIEICYP
jgi:hypothetical protein